LICPTLSLSQNSHVSNDEEKGFYALQALNGRTPGAVEADDDVDDDVDDDDATDVVFGGGGAVRATKFGLTRRDAAGRQCFQMTKFNAIALLYSILAAIA